ncbi:MAG: hypothetical protein AAF429_09015 [Pseudomonadota bacterium]
MTDAAQIRPILEMTKANWVAVREWEGQDLIYFTHLETWRCGLDGVKYGINRDTADTEWQLALCDETNPNALPADYLPFTAVDLKSVNSLVIEITYDDGQTDTATFDRAAIQIQ